MSAFGLPESGPLVLLDTEFTAWEGSMAAGWSRPGEHRELIQIGAVRVDCGAGFAERAAFDRLVRPAINPGLSDYIQDLTGITQAALDRDAAPFAVVYQAFAAFCGTAPILAWGADGDVIAENRRLTGAAERLPAARYHNLRRWMIDRHGDRFRAVSSAELPTILGLAHRARAHHALEDSRALAAALPELLRQGLI